MKYYSELLETMFETPESLMDAENTHLNELAKQQEEAALKKSQESKRRKELAQKVEAADKEVEAAYKNFEKAKAEANAIMSQAQEVADQLIRPAAVAVEDAHKQRVKAISEFNAEFGPFTTSYTGDKAKREFDRINSMLSELFGSFF